jgi:hypothetical protein
VREGLGYTIIMRTRGRREQWRMILVSTRGRGERQSTYHVLHRIGTRSVEQRNRSIVHQDNISFKHVRALPTSLICKNCSNAAARLVTLHPPRTSNYVVQKPSLERSGNMSRKRGKGRRGRRERRGSGAQTSSRIVHPKMLVKPSTLRAIHNVVLKEDTG